MARHSKTRWALVIAGVLATGSLPVPSETPAREFARGMVVSCPRYGQIWGSPEMETTLQALLDLGVGWVAIHPYAGVRVDGSIRREPAAATGYLPAAVEIADRAGVNLFWKPHLAYWGSFSWRGAIEFGEDKGAWDRFFVQYREFIVDQARFAAAAGIELLAVGVELEGTTHRESEWRDIIAAVRSVYPGRITYAANWDSLAKVPFWDAVDVLGVHAYFPLSDQADPTVATLKQGWKQPLETLGKLSTKYDKPVVLAEIGYNRSPGAAREPWDNGTLDTPQSRALRASLIEVALEMIEDQPFIEGMFWWKWMPGTARWDRDFSMKDPEAVDVLRRAWAPVPEAVGPAD